MAKPKVYFVQLRKPYSASRSPNEKRDDPFYEFGSFGCTRCHARNLMNFKKIARIEGAQFAFVQGGNLGSRLVYLTPPVRIQRWADRCEARWKRPKAERMPFKYSDAPVLARNGKENRRDGESHFRRLKKWLARGQRTTMEGQLSSNIRAKATPLEADIAKEVIKVYKQRRRLSAVAATYEESLPNAPPKTDHNRAATYRRLITELKRELKAHQRSDSEQLSAPRRRKCG